MSGCEKNDQMKKNALAVKETEESEALLFKGIQQEEFGKEILGPNNNQQLSKKSKLYNVSPYPDASIVMRVDGSLSRAAIPTPVKHQIILPGKPYVVALLIWQYHDQLVLLWYRICVSALK